MIEQKTNDHTSARTGLAMLLGLAGLAMNALIIKVGWDVDLTFGAFFPIVAAQILPLRFALAATLLANLPFDNDPASFFLLSIRCGEVLHLAIMLRRKRLPLYISGFFYWLAIGAPSSLCYNLFVNGNSVEAASLIALALALAGIAIILMARVAVILVLRFEALRRLVTTPSDGTEEKLASLVAMSVALPTLLSLIILCNLTVDVVDRELTRGLNDFVSDTRTRVSNAIVQSAEGMTALAAAILPQQSMKAARSFNPVGQGAIWDTFIVFPDPAANDVPADEACLFTLLRDQHARASAGTSVSYVPASAQCASSVMIAARLHVPTTEQVWFGAFRANPERLAGIILGTATARQRLKELDWKAEITDQDGRILARAGESHRGESALAKGANLEENQSKYVRSIQAAFEVIPQWQIALMILPERHIRAAQLVQAWMFAVGLLLLAGLGLGGFLVVRETLRRLREMASAEYLSPPTSNDRIEKFDYWIQGMVSAARSDRDGFNAIREVFESLNEIGPVVTYRVMPGMKSHGTGVIYSIAIQRILGVSPESVATSQWWKKHIHPNDIESLYDFENPMPTGAHYQRRHYRLCDSSGAYHWFVDYFWINEDKNSSDFGHGFMLEITEQKNIETELVQAAKLVQLGEIVVHLGHELSQPLNVIKLVVANLRLMNEMRPIPQDQLAKRLDRVLLQVEKTVYLLSHIKQFGRNQSIGESEPFSVMRALDDVLLHVRLVLNERGVLMDIRSEVTEPMALGHSVLFEQIIANLLQNAADAIEERKIREPELEGRICISVAADGPWLDVRVKDNGGGIPKERLLRIFEPFFTTKPSGKGTGIGLSVSARIARGMGGSLSVSNEGDGAEFLLRVSRA